MVKADMGKRDAILQFVFRLRVRKEMPGEGLLQSLRYQVAQLAECPVTCSEGAALENRGGPDTARSLCEL